MPGAGVISSLWFKYLKLAKNVGINEKALFPKQYIINLQAFFLIACSSIQIVSFELVNEPIATQWQEKKKATYVYVYIGTSYFPLNKNCFLVLPRVVIKTTIFSFSDTWISNLIYNCIFFRSLCKSFICLLFKKCWSQLLAGDHLISI